MASNDASEASNVSTTVTAVVGASGGLGQAIVRALLAAGHTVRGVVRTASIEKTKTAFPDIDVVSVDDLATAFNGVDTVIEVVSNTERPAGVIEFIQAAEQENVKTFVACGGAFALFIKADKTRLIDTMKGNKAYEDMNALHIAVQVHSFLFESDPTSLVSLCLHPLQTPGSCKQI
jgi:putative NADH-flavin reductase